MSQYKLLNELKERDPRLQGDGTGLAPVEVKEITTLIRKGAKDLSQKWDNAIHLTKKAYDVAGIKLPKMSQGDAWSQYTHLIGVAVRELAKHRGLRGDHADWRVTEPQKHGDDTIIPQENLPLPLGTDFDDK